MKQWRDCLAFVSQVFEEMSGPYREEGVQESEHDRRGRMQPSEGCKTCGDGDIISVAGTDRSRGGGVSPLMRSWLRCFKKSQRAEVSSDLT